jgi:hypothetical protein
VAVQAENVTEDSATIEPGVVLRYDSTAVALTLDIEGAIPVSIPLQPTIDRAGAAQQASGQRGLEPGTMRVEWSSEAARLLIYVARMSGVRSDEELELTDLDLRIFYSHTP